MILYYVLTNSDGPDPCPENQAKCGKMSLELEIVSRTNMGMSIIGCDHWVELRRYRVIWEPFADIWPTCTAGGLGGEEIDVGCFKTQQSADWMKEIITFRNKYTTVNPNGAVLTFPNEQNVNTLVRFNECWWYDGTDHPDTCWATFSKLCSVANANDTSARIMHPGSYASSIDSVITVLNKRYVGWRVAQACVRGTWMTCEEDIDTCWYIMPVEQPDGTVDWKKNEFSQIHYVNPREYPDADYLKYVPLGHCYPCEASVARLHYSKYPKCLDVYQQTSPACSINVLITDKDKIVCKGGSFPPLLCPVNSRANDDYTECVCEDGKYMLNGVCQPCPIAHFCVRGVKSRCPDDSYQDKEGGSACWPCNYENIKTGCAMNFLPAKCTFANDPVNLLYLTSITCVSCSQCRNSVINAAKTRVGESPVYLDCYDP